MTKGENEFPPQLLPESGPDERGHFGTFGGRFVAETLMPLILDLEKAYADARVDASFQRDMARYRKDYVGRPSPVVFRRASNRASLAARKIYLKREELNHTGRTRSITCLARFWWRGAWARSASSPRPEPDSTALPRQRYARASASTAWSIWVRWMWRGRSPTSSAWKCLAPKSVPVQSGTRTLKDALNEALRDWVTNVHDTFYCIGTVAGPHPYPMMVRDFQSIIGDETRQQMQEAEGRLPDSLVACIGGGSNAMGLFHPFLDDPSVEIFGVEAAGHGLTQLHAASIAGGRPGVLHGNRTYLLMDDDGQIEDAHSISAGLDYPGIGPEHSWLHETGRVTYLSATDEEALGAFQLLSGWRASSRRWNRRMRSRGSSNSHRSGRRII